MGRLRAAVFDFYGTLARASRWGPTVEEVLGGLNLVPDAPALARWHQSAARGVEHPEASVSRDAYVAWEIDRLRTLASGCGAGAPRAAPVADVAQRLYAALKDFELEPYPESVEVLGSLSRRGVGVAVCSNWDWDLDRALEATGLAPHVDVAITSARAGARKPHHRIYRAALAGLGVDAREALFAGDNWEPDVVGPRSVGMDAVHVVRSDVGADAWRPGRGGAPDGDPCALRARVSDLRSVLHRFC